MTIKKSEQLAANYASQAQKEFRSLRSALDSARASFANLSSAIHVPVIGQPRGRIAGSTSGITPLGTMLFGAIGTVLGNEIADTDTKVKLSFRPSGSQLSGQLFDTIQRGSSIR
jgi:hypothetical protein